MQLVIEGLDHDHIDEVTGLDPSYNISSPSGPDSNTGVIERFIEGITEKKISEVKRESLFFVAHSVGGLISRQF